VMPAVLAFLCLGYVLLELVQARLARWPRLQALLPRAALAHGLVACGLSVGFLA
jgi:hypothetical protein